MSKPKTKLDKAQARALTDTIKRDAAALWFKLLDAYERRAWEALGYDNWATYCGTEFGFGKAHGYRLLKAARVHQAVGLHVETRDMTEAQTRVLKKLSPDALEKVTEMIRARGGWKNVNVSELKDMVWRAHGLIGGICAYPPMLPIDGDINTIKRTLERLTADEANLEENVRRCDPAYAAQRAADLREIHVMVGFLRDQHDARLARLSADYASAA